MISEKIISKQAIAMILTTSLWAMKAKRMLANQIIIRKFQCICDTIWYDTRCYFNVRSKVSLIYLTKPTIKKWGKVKLKSKKNGYAQKYR